jgi:hypothetical protein
MMQQRRYGDTLLKNRDMFIPVCLLNSSTYAGQGVFEVTGDNADHSHIGKRFESRDSTRYLRKVLLCFTP